ncbi:RagB/SusD family nutrient uptake outer membrane protein [Flavisolibacter tropicus]|uniref:Glycan metabolism protein n=1 Tax=Flavisolibacter tropicus TaxID=1492898 RepID=A0A172TVB1_9BACT|nr:RagB/SusD family nutrient uptake outer membrane protein [Flavisolibacter tropicus]ANE51061.1 glycan metabolism protein [Flavisolibacter tropicus]
MYSFKQTINNKSFWALPLALCLLTFNSCKQDLLDEAPLSSLSSDAVLTSKAGFETYLVGLHQAAREEMTMDDQTYIMNFIGTDVASAAGVEFVFYKDYNSYLNPATREVVNIWNWAYTQMILRANTVITYAEKPESASIWATEAEKNAVIAEAKFFRAYTYNLLANLYGGVPIVKEIYSAPKTDFVRAARKDVYELAKSDLEFASKWLPATVVKTKEGRIVKAAADHLLSEVYISLGDYDKSIASASAVINSGLYQIMTNRFGVQKDQPGDVYSDLFVEGNQNRSTGNLETIYAWQFENFTAGGGGSQGGNSMIRQWAPFLSKIKDPSGGAMLVVDSLGRGTGPIRGTNYYLYDIWSSDWSNDIRNSVYNMRRSFLYNNPASAAYFGKPVEQKTNQEDTMRNIYAYPRKVEGKPWNNTNTSGRTGKDAIIYRLAETYLLRAEAYLRKGDPAKAADDINVIRARAKAKPVAPGSVTLDYILDERARELISEEPRRRTLTRMGKLVERVRKYSLLQSTRTTIQDKHEFFPIPQTAIDANFSAKLEQNTGY